MVQYEVLTDIGRKRTINEDSAAVYTLPEGILLAVVADGMGGHRGGDFASSTAIQIFGKRFKELETEQLDSEFPWDEWLQESVIHVNGLLYEHAKDNEELSGMGTTLEAVLIHGNTCFVSHIGDSRVYVLNENGIRQVTRDHSYVNVLLESGEITEEEAAVHPQRNWIMRAVGSERTIQPDFYTVELTDVSYLLVCTDGLSNKVCKQSISDIVLTNVSLREKARNLIDLANQRGGEDNISVILIELADREGDRP
ncbi:Stp1/IreP family PP2C-type Ser/Thr phosphatase [Sporosarcina sp. 179-K 3D1 HS]|uniref:Stp1/IreP family PP2C-type Ser/Thr phosphatase n=1 Tax=Sporosarcina sp. 179-K 3D1 HS TaxID=3232169 RepID=UPI0039A2EC29